MKIISKILELPILVYKWIISPVLPGTCRFHPTCSQYALDALRAHGAFRGGLLAMKRLLKCHPWGQSGLDPVPESLDVNKNICGAEKCHHEQM